MRIAIFGDSFGDDTSIWPRPYMDVGSSWIDYLRNQDIEIHNYSRYGTSLFYSHQKFISNYQNYDKIVFLVTMPGRLTVPHPTKKNEELHCTPGSIQRQITNCTGDNQKITLNAVQDYFIHVQNARFDREIQKLLIEDIIRKQVTKDNHSNNLLLIPCFHQSGIDNQTPLIMITEFEAKFWNLKETIPASPTQLDCRKAHMCEENNLLLGRKVHTWIKTGRFVLLKENFKTPTKDFSHYFRADYYYPQSQASTWPLTQIQDYVRKLKFY